MPSPTPPLAVRSGANNWLAPQLGFVAEDFGFVVVGVGG